MRRIEKFNLIAFGQAVQKARETNNWNREQFAEMLNLTPRYLQYIETRGQHPSFQIFASIITILGLSADQFFFPDTTEQKTVQRLQLDALLDEMGKDDLRIIAAIARTIRDNKSSDLE